MAEAIGVASGLLAIAGFAFKASVQLYQTVESFRNQPSDVRELLAQLAALGAVLESLERTIQATSDLDLSSLEGPLKLCGRTCEGFEQELKGCVSKTGEDKRSFRAWAKFKFHGDSIDTFRRSLSSYAATISCALADANLSSATATELKAYRTLVENTTGDLEAHLQSIDDKFDALIRQTTPATQSSGTDLGLIEEERAGTRKCLEICAGLSKHISQLETVLNNENKMHSSGETPTNLTNFSLRECRKELAVLTTRLESYMGEVLDTMVAQSSTTTAPQQVAADLARLREEWETMRQCRRICNTMGDNLEKSVSHIENHGTGDSLQFMVSTNGQVLHGKNQGTGWINRQVGGHLSDESLQELSRNITGFNLNASRAPVPGAMPRGPASTATPASGSEGTDQGQDFGKRFGPGNRLHEESSSKPHLSAETQRAGRGSDQ